MIAACPKCGARYRIERSRLRPEGARVRCSRCGVAFRVRPPPQRAEGERSRTARPEAAQRAEGERSRKDAMTRALAQQDFAVGLMANNFLTLRSTGG